MTATLDRAVFFDHVRKPLFGGSLTAEQVQGMDAIFDACPAALPTDPLAYCLATALREAGPTMQPIREYGRGKGKSYGKIAGPYKQAYYGRGLVQLTWQANYVNATEKLRKLGLLKPDEDLARSPDLALRPDIAAEIMFHGMVGGWFTGKKLADYFGHGKSNPHGARAIINGTDKAALIAGYFTHFRAALVAAKHGAVTQAAAPPATPPAPATAAAKPKPMPDKHAVVSKPAAVQKRTAPVAHVVQKAKHR
jgi:putative chitinase